MKFKFLGDHSKYHCGSNAVSKVIRNLIPKNSYWVEEDNEYDVLIVNGEGSMHHSSPAFHQKMKAINEAQKEGKKTYLINSVWEKNPNTYDKILFNLDGFSVRGFSSKNDLIKNHQMKVEEKIDLSFFAEVDENAPFEDLRGSTVMTDIFSEDYRFIWLSDRLSDNWKRIDMRKMSWSSMVKTLRTAGLLICGRHHGMYAACKAKIPFIPIEGNSHKFSDLLESAKVPIPICKNFSEIIRLENWAKKNYSFYEELFTWMERQILWQNLILDISPPIHSKTLCPPSFNDETKAVMAVAVGDYKLAGIYWESNSKNSHISIQRKAESLARAGDYFIRSGSIEKGSTLLIDSRCLNPQYKHALYLVRNRFILKSMWEKPETNSFHKNGADNWARLVYISIKYAQEKSENNFLETAFSALEKALEIGGLNSAAAARLMIASKLVDLSFKSIAKKWWKKSKFEKFIIEVEEQDTNFIESCFNKNND